MSMRKLCFSPSKTVLFECPLPITNIFVSERYNRRLSARLRTEYPRSDPLDIRWRNEIDLVCHFCHWNSTIVNQHLEPMILAYDQ